jgi:LL-diaminopimelate aminotransferase
MPYDFADRLNQLPPYLFAEIDKKKKAAMAAGRDVINLGIGDPDKPTPGHIIDALAEAARDPGTHTYALDNGEQAFREAIAAFMDKRFGVKLDPNGEIYPTIGSKEAIAHLPLAYINPGVGDGVLIPEPCYPVYRSGTIFAGGDPIPVPLTEANAYLPDFDAIDPADAARAKILWLNYPHSPTGVLATRDLYVRAIAFAREHDLIIAQDAAYTEMYYGEAPLSILEVEGAKDVAIEFHSLSKTFNMTGWRIGFIAGNAEIINGLAKVKANVDSGIFTAVQRAGVAALENYDNSVPAMRAMYKQRRDTFCQGLTDLGWQCTAPEATFYVWMHTPEGVKSETAAARLLDEADVVCTPGNGFGLGGEGYIRATLTVDADRLAEAVTRFGKLSW